MTKTPRVGKKLWLLIAGETLNYALGPGTATFYTRSGARGAKSDIDLIIEVPLTPYQQKRLNQAQGA